MIELKGKNALITGSSRGVGQQIAQGLAKLACNIVVHGRTEESCAKTLDLLKEFNVKTYCVCGELSDEAQVNQIIKQVQALNINIDILYNNAAVMTPFYENFWEHSWEDWMLSMKVNVFAMFSLCKAFIPGMLENGFGRVINLTSGIKDLPELAPYGASKWAVNKMTEDISVKLKDTGVRINTLDPGWLKTDLGGENADHPVEAVLPGALAPALIDDDGPNGTFFSAIDHQLNCFNRNEQTMHKLHLPVKKAGLKTGLSLAILLVLSLALKAQTKTYNFVCTDYSGGKVCMISSEGKLIWEYPALNCNDIWALPNSNFLFNTGHGVKEVTRDKVVVFSYESTSEIYACQRLENGNTFVGECNAGRLLEVSPNGEIVKSIRLLNDDVDGGSAYMRNARKLENGNYLVAHYGLDKVCEYDSSGQVVREIPITGGPHSVIRLHNGNTLIACSDHNGEPRIVEIDQSDSIIWQLAKNELQTIELKFMTGMEVLPNGNLVFTNWQGHIQTGKTAQAFEITRDKKVVWQFNDLSLLKTISSIQLLDKNGYRIDRNVLH